jgi:hypothetical protein
LGLHVQEPVSWTLPILSAHAGVAEQTLPSQYSPALQGLLALHKHWLAFAVTPSLLVQEAIAEHVCAVLSQIVPISQSVVPAHLHLTSVARVPSVFAHVGVQVPAALLQNDPPSHQRFAAQTQAPALTAVPSKFAQSVMVEHADPSQDCLLPQITPCLLLVSFAGLHMHGAVNARLPVFSEHAGSIIDKQ